MSLPCPMCEKPQDGSPTGCPCSYEDLEGALRAAKAELAEASAKSAQTIAWLERRVQREMAKPDDAYAVAQPTAQFAVWEVRGNDDMDFVAQVDGPRETALAEARHYASQVVFDGGTAVIEEVTRREVERLSPVTERRPTRICPQDQHKCVGHRCVDKCFFNPDICTSNLPDAGNEHG